MERQSGEPQIPLRTLGGIDQRSNPLSVAPERWNVLEGFYFPQNGVMARLPGKELYTTLDEGILSIAATNNRKNHVLVQTTTKLHLLTLAELLGRESNEDFSFTVVDDPGGGSSPTLEEEDMSQAIIIQSKAAGTDGTAAATSFTNFQNLTKVSDPDLIITTFSGAAGTFAVAAGTYRIDVVAIASGRVSSSVPGQFQIQLYDVTLSAAISNSGGNTPAVVSENNVNVPCHMSLRFAVSGTTTLAIRGKCAATGANVAWGTAANMGESEVYLIANIIREP